MKLQSITKRIGIGLASLLAVLMLVSTHVVAATVARGYATNDQGLQVGMVAALSSDSTGSKQSVERGDKANASSVIGIVTTISGSLLTLTDSSAQVHVTDSGETSVFSSDINGDIKKGDLITVSPIEGVAMKAGDDDTMVLGSALEDFSSVTTKTEQVKTTGGSTRDTKIGLLKADIAPRFGVQNPANKKPFLVLFGQSLTGKSVSQTQAVVALLIFFVLLVVEGSIIYGAVYSSITSLGRNPLAKQAIFRQLIQVGGLVLLVLAFGLGSLYAVLWI